MMSMHLEKAFLTTTRYSSKKKKSNSKRVAESDAKHNAWLAKQGLTPNQIQLKKAFTGNVRINTKPNRTAPAYSKGAYQYITPGADLSDVGKKK